MVLVKLSIICFLKKRLKASIKTVCFVYFVEILFSFSKKKQSLFLSFEIKKKPFQNIILLKNNTFSSNKKLVKIVRINSTVIQHVQY